MMATAIGSAETCAVDAPASRRFYVHVGSFAFLVAAQPSFFGEVANALALSGASRALDQVVQDWMMLTPSVIERLRCLRPPIWCTTWRPTRSGLRSSASSRSVPSRFGATELLLTEQEQINAWCYEDGYLTYATDENAAAIMYAETGSLRRLRAEIRRSPDFDPDLQMISGNSLFLFDQKEPTGTDKALFYKRNAARAAAPVPPELISREQLDDSDLVAVIRAWVSETERTFEGDSVVDTCVRRGHLMVNTLLRSLPTQVAAAAAP